MAVYLKLKMYFIGCGVRKKYSIDETSKLCRFFFADGEIFSKEIFIDKEMTLIYNIEKFLDLSSVLKGNIS